MWSVVLQLDKDQGLYFVLKVVRLNFKLVKSVLFSEANLSVLICLSVCVKF